MVSLKTKVPRPYIMRIVVTLIGVLTCLFGMAAAGQSGFARLLSDRAVAANRLHFANEAVSLAPSDPEAHLSRGLVFVAAGESDAAIDNFERAAALRPVDYSIWLRLGQARDSRGDTVGALEAFTEAVQFAPYYGQPRWQLGNTLLKAGRKQAAFAELSRAAHSDPYLLPFVIDLVWSASDGKAVDVLRVIQPQTDAERIALARFFINQRTMDEALDLLRMAGSAADVDRHQLIIQLIEAHRFKDASDVWRTGNVSGDGDLLVDGSFERKAISDSTGFVWQILRGTAGVRVALDQHRAHSGVNSLRLDFNGTPDSDAQFVQQLVMLEKNARYELTFVARGENISSGGMPLIAVLEAGENGRMLALSEPLPEGTSDWRTFTVQFSTTSQTEAAYIIIQRKKCNDGTCPIFGQIWFDDFSLRKLQ